MKWKFWKMDPESGKPSIRLTPGPLPRPLFAHLVDELKLGPDWLQSLGCVARHVVGQDHLFAFRAFSPAHTNLMGIEVIDYATLDGFSHLILFSGTFDTQTGRVNLMPENNGRAS